MVEVLVVAEVILAVHVVVMDVEVVELSMSDWSVPFSSGETRVCSWEMSSNPLEASLKPHFQVLHQICYAYAMPLCLTFWSIKVQYSTARKRSEVIWPICDLGKHATYTPYISQVTPILSRLWGYGHVDQCLGHFKWLVSKPKPSPQLPWCSVWLGTEVAAMATLSTASCLSIATAHGWIYELSSFKPCQTCRFQTFREGCLPTTCVFLHGNLFGHCPICSVTFTVENPGNEAFDL